MVKNDNSEKTGQENANDSQKCCPSDLGESACCGPASRKYNKKKLVVFLIVIVAAGIALAHSLMKQSNVAGGGTQQLFATLARENNCDIFPQINAATDTEMIIEASDKTEQILWRPELESLNSLNKVATDTDVVFVLLAGQDQQSSQAITKEVEAAAKKIQSNGNRVCAFRLKKDASDYAQLAKQFSTPCVVAMVKGRGMSVVSSGSGITEAKLIQAFVAASRPSGCGPSGCGPSGCAPANPGK